MHERLKDEVHNAYMEWLKYAEPFCTDICLKQRVEFDFDWKCFVVEMDKYLQVQKIYRVKSLLSSDCIKWTDDEYEVEDAYESEDEHWVKIEHREVGCDDALTIDLLQIDGKRVYTAENMGMQTAETLLSSKKNMSHRACLSNISTHLSIGSDENLETADFDKIIYTESSCFSQDGIVLPVWLETLFPVGLFRIICNCVGDARMSLNVTRHKISELEDDLSGWMQKIGQPMQEKIIHSIKNTIAVCGLACELNKLQICENTEENPHAKYFYDIFRRSAK